MTGILNGGLGYKYDVPKTPQTLSHVVTFFSILFRFALFCSILFYTRVFFTLFQVLNCHISRYRADLRNLRNAHSVPFYLSRIIDIFWNNRREYKSYNVAIATSIYLSRENSINVTCKKLHNQEFLIIQ